jgi:urocanate hydratase
MADMATHCFAGNAARGMSLVALHNGGGVGIGKAINGGMVRLVLDGSEIRVDAIIRQAMPWDVMGGVARRAWARNLNFSLFTFPRQLTIKPVGQKNNEKLRCDPIVHYWYLLWRAVSFVR